jgi:DNA-binding FadR family transcriptional regulator
MTAHDPTERPVRSLQRPEKVFEVVARDIVREIQSKHLEPGSMLAPEAQMLVEYNVGRGSLREALRVLEVHGLIAMKPGPKGGPVVGEVTSSSFGRMASLYFQAGAMTFNELMEARTTLEPTLARLAAERRDPDRLRMLMEAAAPADEQSLADDSHYLRASNRFHRLVIELSGNRVIGLFLLALEDIMHDRVLRGRMLFPLEERPNVIKAHVDIAVAIGAGDGPRAERGMREHMEVYASYVRERYPALIDEIIDWR